MKRVAPAWWRAVPPEGRGSVHVPAPRDLFATHPERSSAISWVPSLAHAKIATFAGGVLPRGGVYRPILGESLIVCDHPSPRHNAGALSVPSWCRATQEWTAAQGCCLRFCDLICSKIAFMRSQSILHGHVTTAVHKTLGLKSGFGAAAVFCASGARVVAGQE